MELKCSLGVRTQYALYLLIAPLMELKFNSSIVATASDRRF